ncbi:hypothetical protein MTR_4g005870 [Medicago truncatula]|uniref:Uncharacterized protein n=1 Tax=Medicago truncatula TaxID=3880 RepID=G7JVJ9_MEDTR|nr:hypothetical protein MTR_4g005870 [Medicago truncatula]
MNYLDPTNKLLIFIGWWVNYSPFFKAKKRANFVIRTPSPISQLDCSAIQVDLDTPSTLITISSYGDVSHLKTSDT